MSATGKPADRGSVTAEVAVLLPGLVALLVALLAVAQAGVASVQVTDAARAAARAAAVGEGTAVVHRTVQHLAGEGATARVEQEAGLVRVTVTRTLPGWLGAAGLHTSATARAAPEPRRP